MGLIKKNDIPYGGGGGGGSVDAYTKAETDALLDNKADQSALQNTAEDLRTANEATQAELTGFKGDIAAELGDLTMLTTNDKTNLVGAINEIDFAVKGLGEPFRVKQWGDNTLNVEIPYCTEDIGNTSIAKMTFSIDEVEGADYQIVGMLAYEVFDAESGGNRINCFPVCQFTGNGQKELLVRWMCCGTTRKIAKRISAWVLLKHR